MRFLNTTTLHFEHVADSELRLPGNEYAILSHRWSTDDQDEVSFKDLESSADVIHKKGYAKIRGFCSLASAAECRYAWADTCCINKGDTAELSEAINSMYRWYQESKVCMVYLEDVPARQMIDSEWFDRGWTLQELIGPDRLLFYDRDWKLVGTKAERLKELSQKTGIPEPVLSHVISPSSCSVAQRMSWAASRRTTRREDQAYSLVGLFGVSMNMTYGEREKAFIRLQLAIIQQSKDESIFAWNMATAESPRPYSGLFAPSPDCYTDCRGVAMTRGSSGFSVNNGELSISLKTFPYDMETYVAILNCTDRPSSNRRITIFVRRTAVDDEFLRVRTKNGLSKESRTVAQLSLVKARPIRVPVEPATPPLNQFYGFWLRTLEPPDYLNREATILSRRQVSDGNYVSLQESDWGTAGIVRMAPKDKNAQKGWSKIQWLEFGFDREFNPILLLANSSSSGHEPRDVLRLRPNQAAFEQALPPNAGTEQRNKIMNNWWIDAEAGAPHRDHGWPSGVMILKGSRQGGINGRIPALNLNISVQLQPHVHPALTTSEDAENKEWPSAPRMIWVVDITNTGDTSPELDHFCSDCGLFMNFIFGISVAMCGFGCCIQEASRERAVRRAYRDHRAQLQMS